MAIQTDSRSFLGTGCGVARDQVARKWTGPIAAAVNMPHGSIAGCLLSDTNAMAPVLYPFLGDGTMRALGFVNVGFDNSSGVQGAREIDVLAEAGHLPDKNAGGGNAVTQADCYKPAYGPDNGSCSKLASDGPCIGMFLGIDPDSGEPIVVIDPVIAALFSSVSAPTIIPVDVDLVSHTGNGTIAFRYTPGFSGKILSLHSFNKKPVTTAAKLATFTAAIAGTPTTGGAVALTSANCTPVGAKVNGTAITAGNQFTAGQEITIVSSGVTAFLEGRQVLLLALQPL